MTEYEFETEISFKWTVKGRTPQEVHKQVEAVLEVLRAHNIQYSLKPKLNDDAVESLK